MAASVLPQRSELGLSERAAQGVAQSSPGAMPNAYLSL